MRTVEDIYTAYRIMPALQAHQLRVASVADFLCDHLNKGVSRDEVILTCLFHDMGNIIKSHLEFFPAFTQPEGRDYWEGVKVDFIQKYGSDENVATLAIAQEIGLGEKVRSYMEGIGFGKMIETATRDSLEMKVCEYADMRVGPHGVVSLEERLREGRERYSRKQYSKSFAIVKSLERFEELASALKKIEEELFALTDIQPDDIHDAAIAEKVALLRTKEIDAS